MTTAAEFDDMNATPLGKLPMPAVQSKADIQRVDMGTSYTDILKEMTNPQQPPPAQPPQQQQPLQPPAPQPHQAVHQAAPVDLSSLLPPAPQAPSPMRPEYPQANEQYQQYQTPRRRLIGKKRRGGLHRAWETAREYRTSALVTAVVFVMLWYVAPKLAHAVPQLLTPSGRFNMAGLAILAVMAGGIHRVADHVVPS